MSGNGLKVIAIWLLLPAVIVCVPPAFSEPPAVGLVIRGLNAKLDGQAVLPYTAVVSGDRLQVKDGVAVVEMPMAGRVVLGAETVATFEREPRAVKVLLERGNVSIDHPKDGIPFEVSVGQLVVLPTEGFRTLGDVAISGGSLEVVAREGSLRVRGPQQEAEVVKGKKMTIARFAARSPQSADGAPMGRAALSPTAVPHGLALGVTGVGGALAGVGIALQDKEKNPTAVEHVAEHVPEPACQHAASPSVPAVACQQRP